MCGGCEMAIYIHISCISYKHIEHADCKTSSLMELNEQNCPFAFVMF